MKGLLVEISKNLDPKIFRLARNTIYKLVQEKNWNNRHFELAQIIIDTHKKYVNIKNIPAQINFKPAQNKKIKNGRAYITSRPKNIKIPVLFKDEENFIVLEFVYEENVVNFVRALNNRFFNPENKCWYIPTNKLDQNEIDKLVNILYLQDYIDFTVDEQVQKIIKPAQNNYNKSMLEYNKDYNCLQVVQEYNNLIQEFLRKDLAYDKKNKIYYLPLTTKMCQKILDLYLSYKISLDTQTIKLIFDINKNMQENYLKSSKKSDTLKMENINLDLFDFQCAGIKFIQEKFKSGTNGILHADDMGLGKTIQTIGLIEHLNLKPALIICPATLKYNWKNEIDKVTSNSKIFVLTGSPKKKEKYNLNVYDYIIINYDIITKWVDIFKKIDFKILVCDESHYLKNPNAKRTKTVLKLAQKIKYKLLLTGTPMLNRPVELVSQLKILDTFKYICVNDWYHFVYKYCDARITNYGLDTRGSSNIDELNELLRNYCMLRRTKEDVLDQLPDKTRSTIYVDITNQQEYKYAETEFIKYIHTILKDNYNNEKDLMDKIKRIKYNEYITKLAYLRYIAGIGKINHVINWVNDFMVNTGFNDKLVIFAYFRKIQDILFNELQKYNPLKITSDMKAEERQNSVKLFQEDDKYKVIIVGIKLGAEGITLTRASNMLFAELYWTPGVLDQCEDRIYRIGQKRHVNIYYLIGKNTIDELIWSKVQYKKKTFETLTTDKQIENVVDDIIKYYVEKT